MEILPPSSTDSLRLRLTGSGFSPQSQVALTRDGGNRQAIVGSVEIFGMPGTFEQVRVIGDRAYLAGMRAGVQVVDIGDPRRPRVLGVARQGIHSPWDLEVSGDLVYVSDSRQGLVILDVSDPTRPQITGRYVSAHPCFELTFSPAGLVFLAQGRHGVLILDVTDPRAPRPVGHLPALDFAWGLAVVDGLAFVADHRAGVQIFDLDDSAGPRRLTPEVTGGSARAVRVRDTLAYVADSERGLVVVDVADPQAPRVLSAQPVTGNPWDVQVRDNLLAFATQDYGVKVFDVTDPHRLRRAGFLQPLRSARGVDLSATHLFVADSRQGLQIADLADIQLDSADPPMVLGGKVSALAANSDLIHAAVLGEGLHTLTQEDPHGLRALGITEKAFATIRDGVLVGDYAIFAAGPDGLCVMDVSAADHMRRVAHLELGGDAQRIALIEGEGLALVALGLQGLRLVDVGIPRRPEVIKSFGDLGNIVDLALWSGGMAALDATGHVHLFDMNTPRAPILRASVVLPDILEGMARYDDTLYVAARGQGLYRIDLRDSGEPRASGGLFPGIQGRQVRIVDDYLYLIALDSSGKQQVRIFHLGSEENPRLEGSLALDNHWYRFRVLGKNLYLFEDRKLNVWDVDDPSNPRLVSRKTFGNQVRALTASGPEELYLFLPLGGILRLDATDPQAPRLTSLAVDNLGHILGMHFWGEELLVLDRTAGLHVFIREASGGLRRLDALGFKNTVSAWGVGENHLYVSESDGRLSMIDLRRPAALRPAGEAQLGARALGLAVREPLVYLAGGDAGLEVWDLSVPERPRLLGRHQLPWPRGAFASARDLVIAGDYLLLANGDAGLAVYALAEQGRELRLVASLPLKGFSRKLRQVDSILYIYAHQAGLHVVDLSDMHRPRRIATIETASSVTDFLVEDENLWLAESAGVGLASAPLGAKRLTPRGRKELEVELPLPPRPGAYSLFLSQGAETLNFPRILRAFPDPTAAAGLRVEIQNLSP
ncbi:hypothetical protein [Geoalkalibacter halelectricus]|uniref:hypothetical protein n=1 Tax=Geoalkalibacter halelectricus TaxID=2847045 RepID=UPI003D262A4C